MTPRSLLCLSLILSTMTLGPASAQTTAQDSSVQVDLEPFARALAPGDLAMSKGFVTYSTSYLGYLAGDVRVTVEVVEAPEWATLTVSPREFTIPIHHVQASGSTQMYGAFRLAAALSTQAPVGEAANALLRVCAKQGDLIAESCGEGALLIAVRENATASPREARAEATDADEAPANQTAEGSGAEDGLVPIGAGLAALGVGGSLMGLVARVAWRGGRPRP